MNTNNKGFAPIVTVLLAVAGVAVIGGIVWYIAAMKHAAPAESIGNNNQTVASSTPLPVPSSTQPIIGVTSTPSGSTSSPTSMTPSKKAPLYPASGSVGTVVTINRSEFAATGNVVTLSGLTTESLKNLPSADGKTIKFTLPENLGPNCKADEACAQYLALVTPGEKLDVVVISDGVSYEIGTFTVK